MRHVDVSQQSAALALLCMNYHYHYYYTGHDGVSVIISEIRDSILGAGYPNLGFSWFPKSPQENAWIVQFQGP